MKNFSNHDDLPNTIDTENKDQWVPYSMIDPRVLVLIY